MKTALNSLYIHWPFCTTKCHYCDFVAFEQHKDFQEAYHTALLQEIDHFATTSKWYQPDIKTIFIGGGTPSLYPLDRMKELITTLNNSFTMNKLEEFSLETNPADINEERLDAWSEYEISRLSLGVQVLDDEVLFKLNRRQRTRDVLNALTLIPKYFDNFSVDLIIGLPGVTRETWEYSLKTILNSPLKHISIYFLTIHEKTPLYYKVQTGKTTLIDDNELIALYEYTVETLAQHGFVQYEISNFAKPGYQSVHNQAYWERLPYKGFGLGACSFDGLSRFINEKNLTTYLTKILTLHDFSSLSEREDLSEKQHLMEAIMLSLRQAKGLDLHDMVYLLRDAEFAEFMNKVELLKYGGFIREDNGKLQLTLRGIIVENEVLARLL